MLLLMGDDVVILKCSMNFSFCYLRELEGNPLENEIYYSRENNIFAFTSENGKQIILIQDNSN